MISGTWYIGYGDAFNPAELKALPPGSFYTEPADRPQFAETREEPMIVQITGVSPSSTGTLIPRPTRDARVGVDSTAPSGSGASGRVSWRLGSRMATAPSSFCATSGAWTMRETGHAESRGPGPTRRAPG